MKVIVIGAEGAVGRAVCNELAARHQIIKVGRNSGEIHADIGDRQSIEAMYREASPVDAVVCAAGAVHFAPVDEFTEDQFMIGLKSKLMGQVNVVLVGLGVLADGGSFTLTSGVKDSFGPRCSMF